MWASEPAIHPMGTFSKKSAIGLTWRSDGRCWGVHLRRAGRRCTAALFWQSDARGGESLAGRLAEGFRGLGATENTVVVVGGTGWQHGFVDVKMPKLSGDDMRAALQFELSKHAPLPAERLVWGYRLLPDGDGDRQLTRLVYMRETDWRQWLDDASGLGARVDAIIPPAVVMDPLLVGREVYLEGSASGVGFLFQPQPGGGRDAQRRQAVGEDVFGALPEPLALPLLEPGGLQAMHPEQQQDYCPAALLAMYGLTGQVGSDRKTWLPVPLELRPRRHRYSRLVAGTLMVYLLVLVAVAMFGEYKAAGKYHRELQRSCAAVEKQIDAFEEQQSDSTSLETLPQELEDARIFRPTLPAVLADLTRLIDDTSWVQQFEWQDTTGIVTQVSLVMVTGDDSTDLFDLLEASPVIGDVKPGQTIRRGGKVTKTILMNARFDTDAEAEERRTSEARLRAEEKAEAEQKPPEPMEYAEGEPGERSPPGDEAEERGRPGAGPMQEQQSPAEGHPRPGFSPGRDGHAGAKSTRLGPQE